jgi:hypothetical protein
VPEERIGLVQVRIQRFAERLHKLRYVPERRLVQPPFPSRQQDRADGGLWPQRGAPGTEKGWAAAGVRKAEQLLGCAGVLGSPVVGNPSADGAEVTANCVRVAASRHYEHLFPGLNGSLPRCSAGRQGAG